MYVNNNDLEKMPIYIFRYIAITLLVTLFFLWLDYSLMWCLITGIVFTVVVELTTLLFVAIILFALEIIVRIYFTIIKIHDWHTKVLNYKSDNEGESQD